MASLNGQTIAASYEQLLHVDADGGGNGTTHVSVKDGDNGTTFGFTIATDALMMTSTNRLEFGDNASYIHQSADGVLDLVSDTEIELNATTIDINGAVDISGLTTSAGNLTLTKGNASNTLIFNANLSSAADNIAFIKGNWNDTTVSQITLFSGADTTNKDDGGMAFATASAGSVAERMRIASDGKVGIGTSSPANESSGTLLHIADTGGSNAAHINLSGGDGADGSQTGKISFSDPGDTDDAVAFISSNISGSNASPGGSLHFFTAVDGSSMAERMKIDSSGKVSMFSGGSHASTSASVYADNLVIRGSNNSNGSGITIFSENDEFGTLYFGDGGSGADAYRGYVQYSHSANELQLGSDGSTRLIIDSDGKVGIGTSSVGASCDMELRKGGATAGDGSGNAGFRFRLARNVGDLNSGDQIGQIAFSNNNDATGGIIQAKADADWASNDYPTRLEFYTTSDGSGDVAERMRIDSSGNVGIGSSSPDEELEVFGASDVGIKLRALGTTSTAESHVPAISFQSDQGDGVTARASISADRDGGATKGALIFKTRISDNITEAMRINSSGNVGIGTGSPNALLHCRASGTGSIAHLKIDGDSGSGDGGSQLSLHYNDNQKWKFLTRNQTSVGSAFSLQILDKDSNNGVFINQDDTSFTSNSDERMKENLVELENATDKLNTLRCVSYKMKHDESNQKRIGLIAQDVYKIYPEATNGSPDNEYSYSVNNEGSNHINAMGLKYTELIAPMIKAIQELSAKVKELEKKLGE